MWTDISTKSQEKAAIEGGRLISGHEVRMLKLKLKMQKSSLVYAKVQDNVRSARQRSMI